MKTIKLNGEFTIEQLEAEIKKLKEPVWTIEKFNKNNFIEQGVVVNNKPLTTIKWHWETKEIR